MTNDELIEKIAWEGNVYDALEYGIEASDIEDPEASAIWRDLRNVYLVMESMVKRLYEVLEDEE
jgi:hypothetical protein